MLTWRDDVVFHLSPGLLRVWAPASGSIITRASLSSVSMDSQEVSQRSRKSLARALYQEIYQEIWLLDTPGDIRWPPQLERCLREFCRSGFARPLRDSSPRIAVGMTNTNSLTTRRTDNFPKQSNYRAISYASREAVNPERPAD